MGSLDEFRHEVRASTGWLESIVRDVTPELAAWQPPGQANTIARTYAHIVRDFDEDLNQRFFERALLSEGPWRGRTGLPVGESVEWQPDVNIDWLALREYGRAMSAFLIETVDALTDETSAGACSWATTSAACGTALTSSV
jgi:hypothetical protein